MVNLPARRLHDAMSLAAILAAGLTLASCTTQPAARQQTATSNTVAAAPSYATFDAALRAILAEPAATPADIGAESRSALLAHYAQTGYVPLWVSAEGLSPRGGQLAYALRASAHAGSPDLRRFMDAIETRRQANDVRSLAELEVLLGAALLEAAVDPIDPTQPAPKPQLLASAVTTADGGKFFAERLPPDPAFWRLRDAALLYREIAATGGWSTVPKGAKLEPGARDPRVPSVRARLVASGDLPSTADASDVYDDQLRIAVVNFQDRHGLAADGVIGPGTLEALNVPVDVRLASIRTNLRRLQQQPRDWGDSYIAINTAAARYRLVDGGRTVFEQVTIVGQPDWKTPEIHSEIKRIELNPFWTVPPRIARLELAAEIAEDPDYLAKHNMRLVDGLYRQDPGPGNALGKAKFLFPNPHDVYLHDTNSHRLFKRESRFLSHGCVRIPNALELAEYLLKDDPNWSREKIDAAVSRGKNRGIALATPMPVHIVYDTAWVDDSGTVHFRKDIYGRDGTMVAATN